MVSNRYRAIAADSAPDALFVVDAHGMVVYANPRVREILGYAPHEVVGRQVLDLLHPDDPEGASLQDLIAGERSEVRARRRLRTSSGTATTLGLNATRVASEGETFMVVAAHDISDILGVESRLSDAHAFLERLIEVSPMVAFKREGPELELTYVSPNSNDILGLNEQDVLGSPISEALRRAHPGDRGKMRDQIERALSGESVEITYRLLVPDNGIRWVVSTLRPDPAEAANDVLLGYMFDITEQREVERELEWLAMHDPLTGLASRAKFESDATIHLSLSARKDWVTALFYIDLDRFKDVNDTFGHDAGDVVLKVLAERIDRSVRDGDLTARLGGDEFVVLLPDVGDDAAKIARRVHEALVEPVALEAGEATVGASVGIAFFPADARDLDDLRRRADEAMYAAKREGHALRLWSDLEDAPSD